MRALYLIILYIGTVFVPLHAIGKKAGVSQL